MSKQTKLKAEVREVKGRKVKNLRNDGFIPSNIFGSNIESLAISVIADDFEKAFDRAGETGIIEIELGNGKGTRNALVSDIQYHPVTDEILHVDFREVDLTKKVSAMVPVEIVGEAPAEKSGLGIMVQQTNELEVEALPLELPDRFELDVSGFETLEDHFTVADIKVDTDKVEIMAEPDQIIANMTEIREEEPEPVVTDGEEEVSESDEAGSVPAEEGNAESDQDSESSNS